MAPPSYQRRQKLWVGFAGPPRTQKAPRRSGPGLCDRPGQSTLSRPGDERGKWGGVGAGISQCVWWGGGGRPQRARSRWTSHTFSAGETGFWGSTESAGVMMSPSAEPGLTLLSLLMDWSLGMSMDGR